MVIKAGCIDGYDAVCISSRNLYQILNEAGRPGHKSKEALQRIHSPHLSCLHTFAYYLQAKEFVPDVEIYTRTRVPWVQAVEGAQQNSGDFDTGSGMEEACILPEK